MTKKEQIEYLATKVMGWRHEKVDAWIDPSGKHGENFNGYRSVIMNYGFKPLTDWNHFRWLEEKVLEDDELVRKIFKAIPVQEYGMAGNYFRADLPTRVSAFISAHQELYGKS